MPPPLPVVKSPPTPVELEEPDAPPAPPVLAAPPLPDEPGFPEPEAAPSFVALPEQPQKEMKKLVSKADFKRNEFMVKQGLTSKRIQGKAAIASRAGSQSNILPCGNAGRPNVFEPHQLRISAFAHLIQGNSKG